MIENIEWQLETLKKLNLCDYSLYEERCGLKKDDKRHDKLKIMLRQKESKGECFIELNYKKNLTKIFTCMKLCRGAITKFWICSLWKWLGYFEKWSHVFKPMSERNYSVLLLYEQYSSIVI